MKMFVKSALFFILLVFTTNVFAQQAEREKGIEFYQQNEYEKAVESLQKIIRTDEKDREAWLYLGMSFAKLKKRKEAVKALKKADKLPVTEPQKNNKDVKITFQPRVNYTNSARMNQIQGTIKLAVEFGADGKLKYIFGFETLSDGLAENAIEAASRIEFEPALKNGKPITAIHIVKYSFSIY